MIAHRTPGARDTYQLHIASRLDQHWSSWFENLVFACEKDGTTTLTGPFADQAHLHGVLNRIRDLGLILISVRRITASDGTDPRRAAPSA